MIHAIDLVKQDIIKAKSTENFHDIKGESYYYKYHIERNAIGD